MLFYRDVNNVIVEVYDEDTAQIFAPGVLMPFDGDLKCGDALCNGVVYPRPPFGVRFDESIPGWLEDKDTILMQAKNQKEQEIAMRTEWLLAKHGMAYDGHTFDMSPAARNNWRGLSIAKLEGLIQYPFAGIQTSDKHIYVVEDEAALKAFLTAVFAFETVHPASPITTGRQLVAQVYALDSLEAVRGFVDPRE